CTTYLYNPNFTSTPYIFVPYGIISVSSFVSVFVSSMNRQYEIAPNKIDNIVLIVFPANVLNSLYPKNTTIPIPIADNTGFNICVLNFICMFTHLFITL